MSMTTSHHTAASSKPHSELQTASLPKKALHALQELLDHADIKINGQRDWDLQVRKPRALSRILAHGSLGLGESYMDGDWDCKALDQLFHRALRARLDEKVKTQFIGHSLYQRFFNPQSRSRSRQVGEQHYDTSNAFFQEMLDQRMTYTCAYWPNADNLDAAQEAKLELVCQKLNLKPGMRLLDIGCGWGSLMKYAAENYGVQCVGLTVSKQQAAHAAEKMGKLPVEFHVSDYREYQAPADHKFDRIASIGMFEHVGQKNYQAFFDTVLNNLKEDGLCLLHTIGKNIGGFGTDPWIHRYIFPNGELPTLSGLTKALENRMIIEDLHNFGRDYDHTLMAWHENFERSWHQFEHQFEQQFGQRFYRMWRYYLLACAGAFRARSIQLWQFVLSPNGVHDGYRRPLF